MFRLSISEFLSFFNDFKTSLTPVFVGWGFLDVDDFVQIKVLEVIRTIEIGSEWYISSIKVFFKVLLYVFVGDGFRLSRLECTVFFPE